VRTLSSTLALFLVLQSTALAAEHKGHHPWLRRLTLAAACAASFWDVQTTRDGIAAGGQEDNPLFSGPQGRPRWGRIVGFKAGTCAASWIAEEHFANRGSSDRFWIGVNTVSAGSLAGVALHNLRVADGPAATPSGK
jgi:hypothetical protein